MNYFHDGDYSLLEKWKMLKQAGVSEETLQVVTDINGYNDQALEDILYVCFGYHDFDDLRNVTRRLDIYG